MASEPPDSSIHWSQQIPRSTWDTKKEWMPGTKRSSLCEAERVKEGDLKDTAGDLVFARHVTTGAASGSFTFMG